MRDDFSFLNQASSVLDGINDWRGAERGERQARRIVPDHRPSRLMLEFFDDGEAGDWPSVDEGDHEFAFEYVQKNKKNEYSTCNKDVVYAQTTILFRTS